jgi:Rod binding domain-containing protein
MSDIAIKAGTGLSLGHRADLAGSSPARALAARQESFLDVIARGQPLGKQGTVAATGRDEERLAEARDAASQLVAITFVQPVLQQLRDSNDAAPPFAPTQGERQFRALLDAELAGEITRAAQFPLVDRLARDLLRLPPQPERMPGDGRTP